MASLALHVLRAAVAIALTVAPSARAGQCQTDWISIVGEPIDPPIYPYAANAPLHVMLTHGDALYAGGEFTSIGGKIARRVAVFSENEWRPLGDGFNGPVYALAFFDDGLGAGETLFAGGAFSMSGATPISNIARWNGTNWLPVGFGLDDAVRALLTYAPPGGPTSLFAGGDFDQSGAAAVPYIARWNGVAWSSPGGGVTGPVRAMAVYHDGIGPGPSLFVGGSFESAGAIIVNNIARWNGQLWLPLAGGGVHSTVHALATWNDGAGEDLYVGGRFVANANAAVRHIARYDGANWSIVGGGLEEAAGEPIDIFTLGVHDDGAGEALYVGGRIPLTAGEDRGDLVRWNGQAWSVIGGPVDGAVHAIASRPVDGGPALWIGGDLSTVGAEPAAGFAVWTNGAWINEPVIKTGPLDGPVTALAAATQNGQDIVYMARVLEQNDQILAWDGSVFSPLGQGLNAPAAAILPREDAVYIGGLFTEADGAEANYVARWNGAAWENFAPGLGSDVFDMRFYDFGEGERLVVGGFVEQSSGPALNHVAFWDGAAWQPLGAGVSATVSAIEVFDGDLYIGGLFPFSGSTTVNSVARWNVDHWEPLQSGLSLTLPGLPSPSLPIVSDMIVFDDALIVAGHFDHAGGIPVSNVARWDGGAWSSVGGGVPFLVNALAVHDRGDGPALYAAGARFQTSPSAPVMARWDGEVWETIDANIESSALIAALVSSDTQDRPSLFIGGSFENIGGQFSPYLGVLLGCDPVFCPADLDGDNFVGFADLNIVVSHFNEIGENIPGDIDDDGQVGFSDLNTVLSQFNMACD